MRPLRGSFWVFVLYDVAEEIELDKLCDLVGAEPVPPQPSFKHPAPEYVRFERPPVVEYPEPLRLETGEQFRGADQVFRLRRGQHRAADWSSKRIGTSWCGCRIAGSWRRRLEGRTSELLRPRLRTRRAGFDAALSAAAQRGLLHHPIARGLDEHGPADDGRSDAGDARRRDRADRARRIHRRCRRASATRCCSPASPIIRPICWWLAGWRRWSTTRRTAPRRPSSCWNMPTRSCSSFGTTTMC